MFSSQLNQVFSQVSGTTPMSPERTASIAGLASVAASTYHWSVSQGSMTTPERSPNGVGIIRSSTRSSSRLRRSIRRRACAPSNRSMPIRSSGIRPSAVCATAPSASSMLSISAALKPARLPTSKSLKSWPGVILTAPEPSSGSACSSAMIGIRRPVIGRRTACRSGRGSARRPDAPPPPCRRASSPAGSSRRDEAAAVLERVARCQNLPGDLAVSTSRSEIAVPRPGSQFTRRLSR
jgi:hypothetical protein